jgi:hypothetical protein
MSATIEPWAENRRDLRRHTAGFSPPPPSDASPEQKDYWYTHIYRGDQVPQLTLRAVAMGDARHADVGVESYTTLKVGWSFGVAITSCVPLRHPAALRALRSGRPRRCRS